MVSAGNSLDLTSERSMKAAERASYNNNNDNDSDNDNDNKNNDKQYIITIITMMIMRTPPQFSF